MPRRGPKRQVYRAGGSYVWEIPQSQDSVGGYMIGTFIPHGTEMDDFIEKQIKIRTKLTTAKGPNILKGKQA